MLRRLLWKEWREQRFWLLGLVVLTAVLMAFGSTLQFVGGQSGSADWLVLLVLAAAAVGGGSFTSEISRKRSDFLMARPVHWALIPTAKALIGLAGLILTVLAAALLARPLIPEAYQHFVEPVGHVVTGSLLLAAITGMGYAAGFVFSAGVGGIFGSLQILTAAGVLMALAMVGISEVSGRMLENRALLICMGAAALLALLYICRFALTAPLKRRLAVYAISIAAGLLIGALIDYARSVPASGYHYWVNVSPAGTYAFAQGRLVDLRTSRVVKPDIHRTGTPDPNRTNSSDLRIVEDGTWLDDERLVWESAGELFVLDAPAGRIMTVQLPGSSSFLLPSPDGGAIMTVTTGPEHNSIVVVDASNASFVLRQPAPSVATVVDGTTAENLPWWQSSREIRYVGRDGVMRSFQVRR